MTNHIYDYDTEVSLTDSDNDSIASDTDYIERLDNGFLDEPKINNQYYIGVCSNINTDIYTYATAITPKTFYRMSYPKVLKYLYEYSIMKLKNPQIDIMKLHILNDGTYSVIKKTLWLRIFQRMYKKKLQERKSKASANKKMCKI